VPFRKGSNLSNAAGRPKWSADRNLRLGWFCGGIGCLRLRESVGKEDLDPRVLGINPGQIENFDLELYTPRAPIEVLINLAQPDPKAISVVR